MKKDYRSTALTMFFPDRAFAEGETLTTAQSMEACGGGTPAVVDINDGRGDGNDLDDADFQNRWDVQTSEQRTCVKYLWPRVFETKLSSSLEVAAARCMVVTGKQRPYPECDHIPRSRATFPPVRP